MNRLPAFLLALGLAASSFSQTADPESVLQSVGKIRSEAFAKAQKEGKKMDAEAVQLQVAAKAKEAVAGLDPEKIAPKEAFGWAQVYRLAGLQKEATALAEKASRYNASVAWQAQQMMLDSYLADGQYDKILRTLDFATFADVTMLGQMGEWVAFGLAPKVQEQNPQLALDALDLLLRRIDLKRPMSESDRNWATFAAARTGAHRANVLYKMGRQDEALKALKGLKAKYGHDKRAADDLQQAINQLSSSNRPATEIKFDRQIGGFAGLNSLKGKVVILDFFAHWCGPCIRAFPMVRELYADLKPKGLEVVGVTSYYGYYGPQQGLSKEQEFERMKTFVKDQNMTWPVAFTDGSANTAYGVSAIPHMVVIDRKGIVRFVEVGFNPNDKDKLRKVLESYLN